MHKLNLSQEETTKPETVANESESVTHKPESVAHKSRPVTHKAEPLVHKAEPVVDEIHSTNDNHASLHSIEKPKMKNVSPKIMIVGILLAVTAGVATGFGTHRISGKSNLIPGEASTQVEQAVEGKIAVGDRFGSKDLSAFKDVTEGYLEAGGIDGEGSHKLLKPGGPSQTVYLTSSVTDLSVFEGMKIKVWGETFKGQQAGWLMDVGGVEVLDTEAKPPIE